MLHSSCRCLSEQLQTHVIPVGAVPASTLFAAGGSLPSPFLTDTGCMCLLCARCSQCINIVHDAWRRENNDSCGDDQHGVGVPWVAHEPWIGKPWLVSVESRRRRVGSIGSVLHTEAKLRSMLEPHACARLYPCFVLYFGLHVQIISAVLSSIGLAGSLGGMSPVSVLGTQNSRSSRLAFLQARGDGWCCDSTCSVAPC